MSADRPPAPSWAARLPRIAQTTVSAGFLLPILSFVVLATDPRFAHTCAGARFDITGVGPFPFAAALLAWLGLAGSVTGIAAAVTLLVLRGRHRRGGLRWSDHGWFLFVVLGLLVLLVDLVMVFSVTGIGDAEVACAS